MAKNKNKPLIIFLIVLIAVLTLTVLGLIFKDQISDTWDNVYNKVSGNIFTHQGMEFKKTKFGNLDMYITSLAITGKDGQTRYFELKLYNDPRKLNNEKNLTKRVLPKSYIALTNSTLDCNGTALAGYKLGEFFTALGSQTKGALTDYARASQDMNISGNLTIKELNELVRNCSNSKSYSIVILDTSTRHGLVNSAYNERRIQCEEAAHWFGVKALRDVSLSISRRETVGIVGESGCGKSTLGKLMLRLEEPTSGRILFRGEDITHNSDRMLRSFRQHTQVVFQDPFSSLNPRQRIGDILAEPMLVHKIVRSRAEARDEAERILLQVGIGADYLARFAHQMSGGQRQRVAIARALAMRPEFIVCDEAVSTLDVSIQAQVVNLLADLQGSLGLSYLFIGHDLAVVRQIATRVMVMYLGRVVEVADRDAFYSNPKHPYSQVLMAAVPSPGGEQRSDRKVIEIRGELPSPLNPPSGCTFRTRCPVVMHECAQMVPELRAVGVGQQVACLRYA